MGIFRKQPQLDADVNADEKADDQRAAPPKPTPAPIPTAPSAPAGGGAAATPRLFDGPRVDIAAIYKSAKLSADELDRVARAEQLLHLLPSTASGTREVVDATFRAFGVDRAKILEASTKQLQSLEAFIRFSHGQTQQTIDVNAKQIAELETEIARCREVSAKATNEGEERARAVNDALLKVQRVLDFFGDDARASFESDLDENTAVLKPTGTRATEPPATRRSGTP